MKKRQIENIIKRLLMISALSALFIFRLREPPDSCMWLFAVYLFLTGYIISYLLMPLMIVVGNLIGMVDRPDGERKIHINTTPRTGGTAVFIGFTATMLICGHYSAEMKSVLAASSIIFITGFIDDYKGLSPVTRIIVQTVVTVFLIINGVRITFVPVWLGGIFTEVLITFIWIIGITNAMNFVDGMDGLAGGLCVIFSSFFAIISYSTKQFYFMYLMLALAGSSLGFLPYNFRKKEQAKIFLGDAGSTFMGFTLASASIMGEWGKTIVDLCVPVIIMSMLIFDMCLTTIVRIAKGQVTSLRTWLAYTGRDHVHHRLSMLGLGKRKTVYLYYCIAVGFGLTSLIIIKSSWMVSLIAIVQTCVLLSGLGIILFRTTDQTYIKFINSLVPFSKKRIEYEKNKNLFELSKYDQKRSDIRRT